MSLSNLEIFGFKSFAQKIDLRFGEGITAIVGPNGCGKTNVVDAIRWVLGEQRPSSLRGNKMDDIIFNGSSIRPPLGMAEVSLTLENNGSLLPVNQSQVMITRRLFRSGESQYLINKTPCRLMDIESLLMGTGIGPHAYSLMEQSMVQALLDDRSESLRHLLEEAAGVTKYKVRRKEALSKLAMTQQDLLRINDLIGEVERNVNSLNLQVRKARRFRSYEAELKDIEIQSVRSQFHKLTLEIRPIREKVNALQSDIERLSFRMTQEEAMAEKGRLDLISVDDRVQKASVAVSERLKLIRQVEQEIAVGRERIESLENLISRIGHERRGTQESIGRSEDERSQTRSEIERLQSAVEETGKSSSLKEKELAELDIDLQKKRDILDAKRKESSQLYRVLVEKRTQKERLDAEGEYLIRRLKVLDEESKSLFGIYTNAENRIKVLRADLESQRSGREKLIEQLNALNKQIESEESRLRASREAEATVKGRLDSVKGQISFWERLQRSHEGYSQGVRSVLNSPFNSKILGTVADIISPDPEYVEALEVALEDVLQYIVTENVEAAVEALKFLKEESEGRATFLPLNFLKAASNNHSRPQIPGVLGIALEKVDIDEETKPLIMALLSDVLFVDNLETALKIRESNGGHWKVVTLAGEVIGSLGQVSGGKSIGDGTSLIGRSKQIETLRSEYSSLSAELTRFLEDSQKHRSILTKLQSQRSDIDNKLRQTDSDVMRLERELSSQEYERNRAKERIDSLTKEKAELQQNQQASYQRILELEKEGDALRTDVATIGREIADQEAEVTLIEKKRQTTSESVQKLRMGFVSIKANLENLIAQMQRSESQLAELQRTGEEREKERKESVEKQEQLKKKLAEDEIVLAELYKKLSVDEKEKNAAEGDREILRIKQEQAESRLKALRMGKADIEKELHEAQIRLAELETKRLDLVEMVKKDRGIDINELPEQDTESHDLDALSGRMAELRELIERIGSVNLAASEEYQEQKERLDFLSRQRDDLVEAEDALKETIEQINQTAQERFEETFRQIRVNFRSTFAKFFNGGEADLRLEDENDPLESPIEIYARPSGRRLVNLNLLSGGEKALTSISLLFALYQIKPSPFCILDEVDAPLDDTNLERFIKALREYSNQTQFMIVTHNKRTMEAADVLQGVTMEEAGVSKLVYARFGRDGNES